MNPRALARRARDGRIGDELSKRFVTPFIVLCRARTGSNLLSAELQARCSRVSIAGEVFRADHRGGDSADDIARRVFRWQGPRLRAVVGCRVHYEHVNSDELGRLLTIEGLKVVHLRRHNALRMYVSGQIARTHDWWWQRQNESAPDLSARAVEVDVDRMLAFLRRYEAAQNDARNSLRRSDVLSVWYEDLNADLSGTLTDVARFLRAGTPAAATTTVLRRQNPEPLRHLILNFGEVERALAGTGWQHYVEADDETPITARARPRSTARPTCWPTPEQALLLSAAVGPPELAKAAFTEWRVDHDLGAVDDGSRRLLPLVYRNIRLAGAGSSVEPELRRRYLATSFENQRLLVILEEVVATLERKGIRSIALKGAALTLVQYRDRGVRPMHDLDVMVPRRDLQGALSALRAAGWQIVSPGGNSPVERVVAVRHAIALRRRGDELDLHWHAFAEVLSDDLDAALWDASQSTALGQHSVQVLSPTDQLLHAFVHGVRYNPVPPLRWITDAHAVLSTASDEIDWQRLTELAERHRLVAQVAAATEYMTARFPGLIPRAAMNEIRTLPISDRERREFNYTTHAHPILKSLGTHWYRYRRREADQGFARSSVGFVGSVVPHLEVADRWRVPSRERQPSTSFGATWQDGMTRFIILTHARTGSNLLRGELNRRCPGVSVEGESFWTKNRPPGAKTADIVDRVFRWREGVRALGCKVFYEHLSRRELSELLRIDGMRVVHLRRHNWLRVYVSSEIAARHHWWLQRRDGAAPRLEDRTVTVDTRRLLGYFRYRGKMERIARHQLRNSVVLDVWYEDLADGVDETLHTVADFLAVPMPGPDTEPALQRQNPEPLSALIANFEDVVVALRGTRWERFLDESAGP